MVASIMENEVEKKSNSDMDIGVVWWCLGVVSIKNVRVLLILTPNNDIFWLMSTAILRSYLP